MADSQTICKSAGKCLAIVLFYYRKQGGKKMTLQQILEEVKNGQLSVEHAEGLLKKRDMRKWIMRNWILPEKRGPVLQR